MKNIFSLFSSWLIWSINVWSFISPCFWLCWSFHATEVCPIWAEFSFFPLVLCLETFSSFYPSHLNSFGWFPRRERGHDDNTLCKRCFNSHVQLGGGLSWRFWVASGSFLYNVIKSITWNHPTWDPTFSLRREKKMFVEMNWSPPIEPSWVHMHAF